MSRSTIDFGIDLGTTNSAIAVLEGMGVQIIKSSDGDVRADYTPSAVFVDKHGRIRVGRAARDRAIEDPANVAVGFKLKMGTNHEHVFANAPQKKFTPEALSTEVLKTLRRDVAVAKSEEIDAAVITVPAAFELPQCQATIRAAAAAGFSTCRLLQEPVAAGLAYGFDTGSDDVFWLVYDLGGGTFDAAVIKVKDGEITVVNHEGDNHLGGKFLDLEIVDRLLIPAVVKQHNITYFDRNNVEWQSAIAKLTIAAEIAKIRLSAQPEVEIEVEDLSDRKGGRTFDFSCVLRRSDIEPLMDPTIDRTVRLCREALRTKKLGPHNIAKVLCVGGPTLTPYLRERLRDAVSGLGIPLEFNIDPMTVVAQGAAIFAGTQRLERADSAPKPGKYSVALEYKPAGADTEPPVGGRVTGFNGNTFQGYTLEFVNAEARPAWRSGRVGLSPDGVFMSSLWAESGKVNTFAIELRDAKGTHCEIEPNTLTYKVMTVFDSPPLIKSLGVALVDNRFLRFFDKGRALPAKKKEILHSTVEVRPGASANLLHIPVAEGENDRADRNQVIGMLTISGAQVSRVVPAGSEIELLIEIDESRQVRTRAYVPILDEEFEKLISYDAYREQARNPVQLRQQLEAEKKRLVEVRQRTENSGAAEAKAAVQRIDGERILQDAESAAASAGADQDEADRAEKRLLELRAAVDQIEDALEWPQLVAAAEQELAVERRIIETAEYNATAEEKAEFAALQAGLGRAIAENDRELVRRKKDDLDRLGTRIVLRQPGWWVEQLKRLEARIGATTEPAQAQRYLDQGRRAIMNNDVEGLKSAVRQILALLPPADPDRVTIQSGVTKY